VGRYKKNIVINNLEITGIAAEGKAIARVNDMVIFISGAVPGDVIDLQVTRKKHSYAEGYPIAFHKLSEKRVAPICKHFGVCGGCTWQMLPYAEQLKYKQQQVVDNLQRIGKIELPEIKSILPSKNTSFYRNKLEFTFSDSRWLTQEEIDSQDNFENRNALGFHIPTKFDKVLDIDFCHLQPDPSNAIRQEMKDIAMEHNLPFFNIRNKTGFLRNIIIRNTLIGEWMVIVAFADDNKEKRELVLDRLASKFPEISALLYVINDKANDTINDLEVFTYKGRDHIIETMEDLRFRIGPKSFFQTNTAQALNLYQIAAKFADVQPVHIIYDLYTGTGTIANFVARKAKKVIGIEYIKEAIDDAKVNSALNNITNTEFFAGDIKDILTSDFIREKGKPDTMIIDPPRAGMHPDVVQTILEAEPQTIVYVSCNPATQARDINLLGAKYKVTEVQPVDMFPHTTHVENVVKLIMVRS
jgi:23S rRNA (uracil1939-C5)-methyltransferase